MSFVICQLQNCIRIDLFFFFFWSQKINQPYPQQSSLSHREIAWHQASSSVFSWQPEKTPSRNQETPAKRSSTTSYFPWEKETNSSIISEKKEFNNSFAENYNSSLITPLRAQNQGIQYISLKARGSLLYGFMKAAVRIEERHCNQCFSEEKSKILVVAFGSQLSWLLVCVFTMTSQYVEIIHKLWQLLHNGCGIQEGSLYLWCGQGISHQN